MLKREEPIAESDCKEGRVHKMMTSIRKTVSPDRNDIATGSGGAPRSVALNARPVFIAMTLLAAIAVGMMLLLPGSPLHAQDTTISYAENGTGPVATFTATDPEGDTIVWSVSGGADRASFTIDPEDGELTFISPPDYEASEIGDGGGDDNNDNTYEVVVTATDNAETPNADTFTVNVKVTNVAEPGKVTWTVDPDGGTGSLTANVPPVKPIMQFQPGAILTASVTDDDIAGSDKAPSTHQIGSGTGRRARPRRGRPSAARPHAAYTVQLRGE